MIDPEEQEEMRIRHDYLKLMEVNHDELQNLEQKVTNYSVIKDHPKNKIITNQNTPRSEVNMFAHGKAERLTRQ